MSDEKKLLRHRALADRDKISLSKAEDAAIKIAFLARDLVEQLPHKCDNPQLLSALYWPIRSEVNTLPLINLLLQSGRPVALPIMIKMKYPLVFRLYKENDQLITNKYGLCEPLNDKEECAPDLLFIPLAAFDRNGFRLGYGGGIYDATISLFRSQKKIITIGLAYASQEVARVPTEPHDQNLDYIITEKELISLCPA